MNGILFIDFNLAACDFLKFDRCEMVNGYILSLRMTIVSVERWKIDDGLNKTWITSNSLYFIT